MIETLDLRVTNGAARFLKQGEASMLLPEIYGVKLNGKDPRLPAMTDAEQEAWARDGVGFVLGWEVKRRYTAKEVSSAKLFRLIPKTRFRPVGEECGTDYDVSELCPFCGAGRIQRGNLMLDLGKPPRGLGIAVSLSGEILVSEQTAELMLGDNLTGFVFAPVHHRASAFDGPVDLKLVPSGRELLAEAEKAGLTPQVTVFNEWLNQSGTIKALFDRAWVETATRTSARSKGNSFAKYYQLIPKGHALKICEPTRFGINPLNADLQRKYRCPQGHTEGHNALSEISIDQSSWDGADFCVTKQMVGYHPPDSLIYPEHLLIVSAKFRSFIEKYRHKGFGTEVARLV